MKFNVDYSSNNDLKTREWTLNLSEKALQHILNWHSKYSNKINKTKFKSDEEIFEVLNNSPYLEQIGKTKEYRWWDLRWKYNITTKQKQENEFDIITLFRKN